MYETQPPNGTQPGDGGSLVPALRCEITRAGDDLVAALDGELDLASAPEVVRRLQAELARPADAPVRALVLDLARMSFVDSSGLGALCQLQEQTAAADVGFRLDSVPEHAMRVFEITGLTGTFGLD
jgi:anti-sigma B factor antagonist